MICLKCGKENVAVGWYSKNPNECVCVECKRKMLTCSDEESFTQQLIDAGAVRE